MRIHPRSLSVSITVTALIAWSGVTSIGQAADARANWDKHCVDCHGEDGRSQTRSGRKSRAPDLTDKKVQSKMTDEEAFKAIKFGRKNAAGEEKMDAFGNGLSDAEITSLVTYVRALAK